MNKSRWPLYLTTFRMGVAFPICALLMLDQFAAQIAAVILFYVASVTDYYDGYLARRWNAVTNLGKFLDPVADKILVSSVLTALVFLKKVDIWMVVLFISRDTLVGGIRAAASADGLIIDAQTTGKWKAALQMISIPLLMLDPIHSLIPQDKIGYYLLWFSVILSLASGWQYIQMYFALRKTQN
jgi:CDP-diacylglycerol--glycerol-3-phosphate 3-phosphatidyltransferase